MSTEPAIFIVNVDRTLGSSLERMLRVEDLPKRVFLCEDEFFATVPSDQHGCVILHLHSTRQPHCDVQSEMRSKGMHMPLIVLDNAPTVPDTIQAFEKGAFRVLLKPVKLTQLLNAVREALSIDHSRAQAELDRDQRLCRLTPREREVLELLVQDKAAKLIARELMISSSTVAKHRANIMEKLGINSVVGLANYLANQPKLSNPIACHSPDWSAE